MGYKMTAHLRQSNLIEGIDNPKADAQALVAWEYLIKQWRLDATVIKRTHKIIMQSQTDLQDKHKGNYRTVQVYVGKHVPPPPQQVKAKMTQWVKTFRNYSPREAHVQFETIHPFIDGNGRIGRMLMWWQEIKAGNEPTLLTLAERPAYYAWFSGRGQRHQQTDILDELMLNNARSL